MGGKRLGVHDGRRRVGHGCRVHEGAGAGDKFFGMTRDARVRVPRSAVDLVAGHALIEKLAQGVCGAMEGTGDTDGHGVDVGHYLCRAAQIARAQGVEIEGLACAIRNDEHAGAQGFRRAVAVKHARHAAAFGKRAQGDFLVGHLVGVERLGRDVYPQDIARRRCRGCRGCTVKGRVARSRVRRDSAKRSRRAGCGTVYDRGTTRRKRRVGCGIVDDRENIVVVVLAGAKRRAGKFCAHRDAQRLAQLRVAGQIDPRPLQFFRLLHCVHALPALPFHHAPRRLHHIPRAPLGGLGAFTFTCPFYSGHKRRTGRKAHGDTRLHRQRKSDAAAAAHNKGNGRKGVVRLSRYARLCEHGDLFTFARHGLPFGRGARTVFSW